jgi:hypothetical protein
MFSLGLRQRPAPDGGGPRRHARGDVWEHRVHRRDHRVRDVLGPEAERARACAVLGRLVACGGECV